MPEHQKSTATTATARRANPNQSHLGLKSLIISSSIMGTVVGWGVLASTSVPQAQAGDANATAKVNAGLSSDSLLWAVPNVLARNDVPPVKKTASPVPRIVSSMPPIPRAVPSTVQNTGAGRSTQTQATPKIQSNVASNSALSAPSGVREVHALPSVQPRQVQPVARSHSSR